MQTIKYPKKADWTELTKRPVFEKQELELLVKRVLNEVRTSKDEALFRYTKEFDGIKIDRIRVSKEEVNTAEALVPAELKAAMKLVKNNIEKFHKAQQITPRPIETSKGILCWQKNIGIEKVGLYIPGGSAPLFSTLLMLGIPAKLAACKEVILCTPPDKQGQTMKEP
jgi:histidinol dehydrogenase